jgi:hypothetical protein
LIAAFPSGWGAAVAVASAIGFWLIWEFTVRKRRTARTWLVDGAVWAVIFVAIALLPVRVHARFAWLSLGFITFSLVLLVALFVCSAIALKLYRRRQRAGDNAKHAKRIDVPPLLHPGRDGFMDLGFDEVASVELRDKSRFVFLIHPEGHVGEVVSYPPPYDETPVLEITTTLGRRTGSFATSTFGLNHRLWPGELRQVFPGASVDHLLENHRRGLDFLRERGIEADPIRAEELFDVREQMLAKGRRAAARAPSRVLRSEILRARHGRHASVGLLALQDDVDLQIDAFYELMTNTRPVV